MKSVHSSQPEQMPRKLNSFWKAAFIAAELRLLAKGKPLKPTGLAHLAAEFADAAVTECRKRYP